MSKAYAIRLDTTRRDEDGRILSENPPSWWGVGGKEYVWADKAIAVEYLDNLPDAWFKQRDVFIEDVFVVPVSITEGEGDPDSERFNTDRVVWSTETTSDDQPDDVGWSHEGWFK
jgi:hypothetical protein